MTIFSKTEQSTIRRAMGYMLRELKTNPVFSSPELVKDYMRLHYAGCEREEFTVIYLDAQLRLIECKTEFVGTLSQTSVYPREIVKRAVLLNAASVILSHNHPSGNNEPSRADELLTQALKSTLALIDCRVLDHLIVGHSVLSFAEKGLI
jgi:DNA repair protein RadC